MSKENKSLDALLKTCLSEIEKYCHENQLETNFPNRNRDWINGFNEGLYSSISPLKHRILTAFQRQRAEVLGGNTTVVPDDAAIMAEYEKQLDLMHDAHVPIGNVICATVKAILSAPTPPSSNAEVALEEDDRETLIKHMVNRFLGWKLPNNFAPDHYITFDRDAALKLKDATNGTWPIGTNLLDEPQAREMVEHMLNGFDTFNQKYGLKLPADMLRALRRFMATTKEDGTFDIGGKELIFLVEFGAICHHGWGIYSVTKVGQALANGEGNRG